MSLFLGHLYYMAIQWCSAPPTLSLVGAPAEMGGGGRNTCHLQSLLGLAQGNPAVGRLFLVLSIAFDTLRFNPLGQLSDCKTWLILWDTGQEVWHFTNPHSIISQ